MFLLGDINKMVLSNTANLSIVFGVIAFFLTAIIMLIIILRRRFLRNTIRVGFISKGGFIERRRYKQETIGETITFKKGMYEFDPNAVVTTFWGKEIYYSKENTRPIYFDKNGIKKESNITPDNLKAIIQTELIAKLFKKEILNTENILIFVVLVLQIVSIALLIMLKTKGVDINPTPENIAFFKNIVTQAITGV